MAMLQQLTSRDTPDTSVAELLALTDGCPRGTRPARPRAARDIFRSIGMPT